MSSSELISPAGARGAAATAPAAGSSGETGAPQPSRAAGSAFAFEQLENHAFGRRGADILSSAWEEAEQVRAQARAAGEAEGRAEGLAAALAQAAPALETLSEALRSLEEARLRMADELEREAAELAVKLAEQIVGGALAVQPERVIDITRGALRRLAERNRVTLLVNPIDHEVLAAAVERLRAELGGIEHIDIHADRRIDRGGSVVRTELGEIDATVSAQLARAREVVEATLAPGAPPHEPRDAEPEA